MVAMQETDISELELLLSKKENKKENGAGSVKGKGKSKFDALQSLLSMENKVSTEIKQSIPVSASGQNLISCDVSNSKEVLVSLTKRVLEEGKTPVVVLTSMNYKAAKKKFALQGISQNHIFIIDTVTKNILNEKDSDRIKFIDSLRNLTQLQIKIIKLIESNKDLVFVFDSLNVLELYHEERILLKFVYSFVKIIRKKGLSGFYIINNSLIVPKLVQFFDDLIEIGKVS
jgi:hypothetical protein